MNRQEYFQKMLQPDAAPLIERYEDHMLQLDEGIWGTLKDKAKSAVSTVKTKINSWLKGKDPKKKKKAEQMRGKMEKVEKEARQKKEKAIAKVKDRAERQGISLKKAEEDVPWFLDIENWIGNQVLRFEKEILGYDAESRPSRLSPGDYAAAARAGGSSGRTSGGTTTKTKVRGYLEGAEDPDEGLVLVEALASEEKQERRRIRLAFTRCKARLKRKMTAYYVNSYVHQADKPVDAQGKANWAVFQKYKQVLGGIWSHLRKRERLSAAERKRTDSAHYAWLEKTTQEITAMVDKDGRPQVSPGVQAARRADRAASAAEEVKRLENLPWWKKLFGMTEGMDEDDFCDASTPALPKGRDDLGAQLNLLTESLSVLEAADDVLAWWEEMKGRLPRNLVLDIQQKINAATGHLSRADDPYAGRKMYKEAMADVLRRARAELEVKLAVVAHETKSEKTHRTLIRNMQMRAEEKGRHYGLVELEQIWRREMDNEDLRRGYKKQSTQALLEACAKWWRICLGNEGALGVQGARFQARFLTALEKIPFDDLTDGAVNAALDRVIVSLGEPDEAMDLLKYVTEFSDPFPNFRKLEIRDRDTDKLMLRVEESRERDQWFFARVMKNFKAKIGLSESTLNESWDILSWARKHWTLVKTTVEMYQQDPSLAKAHVRELEKQYGDKVQESLQEASDEPPSVLMKVAQWLWGWHPSTHLLWMTAVALLHVALTEVNYPWIEGSMLVGVWAGLLGWVLKFRGMVESLQKGEDESKLGEAVTFWGEGKKLPDDYKTKKEALGKAYEAAFEAAGTHAPWSKDKAKKAKRESVFKAFHIKWQKKYDSLRRQYGLKPSLLVDSRFIRQYLRSYIASAWPRECAAKVESLQKVARVEGTSESKAESAFRELDEGVFGDVFKRIGAFLREITGTETAEKGTVERYQSIRGWFTDTVKTASFTALPYSTQMQLGNELQFGARKLQLLLKSPANTRAALVGVEDLTAFMEKLKSKWKRTMSTGKIAEGSRSITEAAEGAESDFRELEEGKTVTLDFAAVLRELKNLSRIRVRVIPGASTIQTCLYRMEAAGKKKDTQRLRDEIGRMKQSFKFQLSGKAREKPFLVAYEKLRDEVFPTRKKKNESLSVTESDFRELDEGILDDIGEGSAMTEAAAYVSALAAKKGISVEKAEARWAKAKAQAEKQGRHEDWAYITGIFKKMMGESAAEITEVFGSDAWAQFRVTLQTNKAAIMQKYQAMMDDPDEFERCALEMKRQYETGQIPEGFMDVAWAVIKSPWELFKFLKETAKELLASPNLSERALIALGIAIISVYTQVGVLGMVGFLGKVASAIIGVMIVKDMIFGSKPE